MRFILPRVLALTVIAGLGALVLSLLFKVLLCASIIIGVGFALRRSFRRHGHNYMADEHTNMHGFAGSGMFGNRNSTVYPFQSAWQQTSSKQQRPQGITPLN